MQPEEQRYIDKSSWPHGPWKHEPDRVEWRSEGTPRLAMRIVRNSSGALCGYVGVPEGHPWHGKDYGDVDAEVHGGLTFADRCQEGGKICHVPQTGEAETVWWLGFDCAHMDAIPSFPFRSGSDWYKDIDYVRSEVQRLAEQAQRVAKGLSPREGA